MQIISFRGHVSPSCFKTLKTLSDWNDGVPGSLKEARKVAVMPLVDIPDKRKDRDPYSDGSP